MTHMLTGLLSKVRKSRIVIYQLSHSFFYTYVTRKLCAFPISPVNIKTVNDVMFLKGHVIATQGISNRHYSAMIPSSVAGQQTVKWKDLYWILITKQKLSEDQRSVLPFASVPLLFTTVDKYFAFVRDKSPVSHLWSLSPQKKEEARVKKMGMKK